MNEEVRCAACGVLAPSDVKPAGTKAYGAILKDWRTWAIAFASVFAIGMICGALHLPTASVGAGGGALIGLYVATRASRMKACGRCGAVLR